ncbi:MAG: ATP-binding protein [Firmicutes bacterium]|nr:ATP-binding protein [Bacillota bacterium]
MDDIYSAVGRMYEKDRLQNAETADARRREVYEKIPRIQEIDDTFSKSSIDMARLALTQGGGDSMKQRLDEYKAAISRLNDEKTALLTENGYPADYLCPIYTCPVCKDTGVDGTRKCACFYNRIITQNYILSGMADILRAENFDTFNANVYSDTAVGNLPSPRENALKIAKKIKQMAAEQSREKPCSMILTGQTGTGKTFMCNCAAKALLDKGLSLYYTSAFSLFNDISDRHFGRSDSDAYTMALQCDVLVIDDLGVEIGSNITNKYLLDIINQRIRQGGSTIITTNQSLKNLLENYGDRIGSRFIQHYTVFNLYGSDIRVMCAGSKTR